MRLSLSKIVGKTGQQFSFDYLPYTKRCGSFPSPQHYSGLTSSACLEVSHRHTIDGASAERAEMTDEKRVEDVEEVFKRPLGVTSEDDGDDRVRVCVVLPGLKKKMFGSLASNGTVDCKFELRSIDLKVTMTTKRDKFRYHVKRLPDEIKPEKCQWKVKEGQVVITLHKAKPKSWARELEKSGLETFVDGDEKQE